MHIWICIIEKIPKICTCSWKIKRKSCMLSCQITVSRRYTKARCPDEQICIYYHSKIHYGAFIKIALTSVSYLGRESPSLVNQNNRFIGHPMIFGYLFEKIWKFKKYWIIKLYFLWNNIYNMQKTVKLWLWYDNRSRWLKCFELS